MSETSGRLFVLVAAQQHQYRLRQTDKITDFSSFFVPPSVKTVLFVTFLSPERLTGGLSSEQVSLRPDAPLVFRDPTAAEQISCVLSLRAE